MSRRRSRHGERAARRERIERIASVLSQYEASPFEFEGPALAAIRADLCLAGWPWEAAHQEARQLVLAALDRIGARRPSWEVGQPEAVHSHLDLFQRTRCARCGKHLPEGRRKFCSQLCGRSAAQDRKSAERKAQEAAARQARREAYRAKQELRDCAACGVRFKPNHPRQQYCGSRCAAKHNGRKVAARQKVTQ